MQETHVLPVNLGRPGVPPSPSDETKEILLADLDDMGYQDEAADSDGNGLKESDDDGSREGSEDDDTDVVAEVSASLCGWVPK